jgi:type II secretory pathway pseudopilin PulG
MVATSPQPRQRQLEGESGAGRRSGPRRRTAQPALAGRVAQRPDLGEGGFTLVELMIAALITTIVLGGAVALATQIQQGYSAQLEDAALEQEVRYALDWIARDLRSAASDPYDVIAPEDEVLLDPNGDEEHDDIQVRADIAEPDGVLGAGEDITIALDSEDRVITRQDHNAVDNTAIAMTDAIFTDLSFTYFDAAHMPLAAALGTVNSALVAYVRVHITAQSRALNPVTQVRTTSILATEVRLRTR